VAREGRGSAEVTLSESEGVRYLHFGTDWVQGAMLLADPVHLELEYQQQMMAPLLLVPEPREILQLGLGAAALTKFCHRHLRASRIRVVELSPQVIQVARQWFALPREDARLQVIAGDAGAYVRGATGSADWLQVDLYDATARGPVLDDPAFYRACRRALRPGGVAAFNLFNSSLRDSLERILGAFGPACLRLPRSAAGNTVVLACVAPLPALDADELQRRALQAERRLGLPLLDWLAGMRTALGRPLLQALAEGAERPSGSSIFG
jgi:spermidine synthase